MHKISVPVISGDDDARAAPSRLEAGGFGLGRDHGCLCGSCQAGTSIGWDFPGGKKLRRTVPDWPERAARRAHLKT